MTTFNDRLETTIISLMTVALIVLVSVGVSASLVPLVV